MSKYLKTRKIKIFASVLLACMTLTCIGGSVCAIEGGNYIPPDHLVDFSNPDNVGIYIQNCFDVSAIPSGGGAKIVFIDTSGGYCGDPYAHIKLPSNSISCEEYPYFAMLVKTNKSDIRGEVRFRTESTADQYPCQAIKYESTSGWQVVICKLTDKSSVYFYPPTMDFKGNYTEVRLDMFDNAKGKIPTDTEYYIKAAGFYKNAEDAATLINFGSENSGGGEEENIDVNYSSFWLGEEFKDPANSKRMNILCYGFGGTTYPIDAYLSEGYGGIVSNVNFNQKYLKDPKEFENLKKVYDYADSKDMTLWIYDEYQWPSGKAYGLVLDAQSGREWEATGIERITLTGEGGTASYNLGATHGKNIEIKIMQAVLKDNSGTANLDIKNNSVSKSASGKWTLDVYLLRYTYDGVEDRNDFTTLRDVDLLNPDEVDYFINITHGQYKKYLGESFKNITAFFTDEPQLGNRDMLNYAVWTNGFEERFFETYGYNINLPSLYAGQTDFDRMVRVHYYDLVASMFKEAYIDQITKWCEENGVASSGHLLFEEDMNDHIETYGGNFMQVVGGMTIPGVDVLWVDPVNLLRQNNIGNYMGIRYVSSAAKNAGKNDVMIEYNPNAAGALDASANVLGDSIGGLSISRLLGTNIYNVINPTRNYTNSELNTLNTYVGRLNTILDNTIESGELAVFYPIATVQAYHNAGRYHSSTSGKDTGAVEINSNYESFCLKLLKNQYMFTVIDDESIRSSKINGDGDLVIGNGCYSTVVIPYTEYMSVESLQKLADFKAAGGSVMFYHVAPAHGLKSGEEDKVADIMANFEGDLYTSLGSFNRKLEECVSTEMTLRISGDDSSAILMGDFESEDKDVTFIVNTSNEPMEVKCKYTDDYRGEAHIYYPGSGRIVSVNTKDGAPTITIPAFEGVMFVRNDENDLSHGIEDNEQTPNGNDDENNGGEADTTVNTPEINTEDNAGEDGGKKKGCKSTLGASAAVAFTATLAGCAITKKRKKETH